MDRSPEELLEQIDAATGELLETVGRFTDEDVRTVPTARLDAGARAGSSDQGTPAADRILWGEFVVPPS